jgi:hypothetical protein
MGQVVREAAPSFQLSHLLAVVVVVQVALGVLVVVVTGLEGLVQEPLDKVLLVLLAVVALLLLVAVVVLAKQEILMVKVMVAMESHLQLLAHL